MTRMENARNIFGETLLELGREHPEIVALNADLSSSTKTSVFADEFPNRFFNAGIAEQCMMGMAAGLATCGKTVVPSTFAVFATGQVYNVIRQSIAYPKLNVKIAASHAGISVGGDGATHQMCEDIALMRALPNMTVVVPADSVEAREATRYLLLDHKGPAYLRMGRSKTPVIHDDDYEYLPNKVEVIRDGCDITFIACGWLVAEAIKASDTLKKDGISAKVLNCHTVKPLDVKGVEKAAKECGAIITAEEHSVIGGLGAEVARVISKRYPVQMRRVGIQDVFGESGEAEDLMTKFGMRAEDLIRRTKKMMKNKGKDEWSLELDA